MAAIAGVVLLAGCTAAPTPSGPASSTPTGTATGTPNQSATTPAVPKETQCAADVVETMNLAEQVGQLVMVGVTTGAAAELNVLRKQQIGSVIVMGTHREGVRGVKKLTASFTVDGQKTPILVAVDQEGGTVQRLKGSGFDTIPTARSQSTWSTATLKSRAAEWGEQLADAGVQMTLAPVADVVPVSMRSTNAPIGQLKRDYGADPKKVADRVAAVIDGMQSAGVATSAKHFPGLGRVRGNTDFSARVIDSVTTTNDPFMEPFQAAIKAGGESIMMSTAFYARIDSANRAVFSSKVIGLLRNKFGFDGVIISDDLGVAQSVSSIAPASRGIRFIKAGGDLAITVDPYRAAALVRGIRTAAEESTTVAAQVKAAAIRVVTLKVKLGLVPCR